MRIAIAQLNPVVGAFEKNVAEILVQYQKARASGARVLLTPELSVCGYPPHDLLNHPEIFSRNERALEDLIRETRGGTCALAVGHVARNERATGRLAANAVSVLENGAEVFRQTKMLLPTYDVFDEARYFEPADQVKLWSCDGHKIAIAVCEDLWGSDERFGRRLYGSDPTETYRKLGAELLVSLSASPYERSKSRRREDLHRAVVKRLGVPLLYVNQIGATDEILFDGGSFAMNADGTLSGRLRFFETSSGHVEWSPDARSVQLRTTEALETDDFDDVDVLSRGLVTGIREYFSRTGFSKAIIGLSGGIDSAVVCALAVRALDPSRVLGVAMPSQFSSAHSLKDAQDLAARLGIEFEVRPIKFLYSMFSRELAERRGGVLAPIALENLQARIRGTVLMTLANHYGGLVLTTGNKSELAMGYCTLYGDMVGALAPIGDLFKTRVYDLARFINSRWGSPIPENSLSKAPSAELRPDQRDEDTLPPYDELDPILEAYIEENQALPDLETKHAWVRDVIRRLELNEYKRRQAAPVLKVSARAFGIGRRVPIAKHWETAFT